MRILVVEDEKKIASFIQRGLKEHHYAVDIAYNGERASELIDLNSYDLMLLDLMLPDKDGVAFCKEIRNKKINIPILMLTARDAVKDKVLGLNAGADDYLTKPFAFEELLARIRSLLRRKEDEKGTVIKVHDLELDRLTHGVMRGGKKIELTSKEYSLLEYLMIHKNQVVTRTMVSEHVWNEDFDTFTNVIDVYITHLRNKIDKGFEKALIHTVRGSGYVIKG
ncbi:MAG: response regulator transcription factor [bacterium]